MKQIVFKALFGAFATLILFASCSKDDPVNPVITKPERTVLLYLAADNNLSRLAYKDLEEVRQGMTQVSSSMYLMVYADMGDGNAQLLKFHAMLGMSKYA